MRLVFMGSPNFAVPSLNALASEHDIVAVYTQPPRAAGRGNKEQLTAVNQMAKELGLPVFTPKNLKNAEVQEKFVSHAPDAVVVAAYGLILPQAILHASRLGCINVHASLLPRWRGAAPIQRAIMAGDKETGITLMHMDAGLDTGAIFEQRSIPITDATTAGALHDALAGLGAEMAADLLAKLGAGSVSPTSQPASGVTYADKIEKSEAKVDFDSPAQKVLRQIHGLSPFPGAFAVLDGQRLKFLLVEAIETDNGSRGAPGTVLDETFTVACGSGAIRPIQLQRSGKGATDISSFLRGFELRPGSCLG